MTATEAGRERRLTEGERGLVASVFGDAIDRDAVAIHRRKWFPFQPKRAVMAPCGHIHVHPKGRQWSEDYSREGPTLQGLFIHEMAHVWQAQTKGRWYLPLMRHPFCVYAYRVMPGWSFARYGLEQQAEIVRHVFQLRRGQPTDAPAPLDILERLLPFGNGTDSR